MKGNNQASGISDKGPSEKTITSIERKLHNVHFQISEKRYNIPIPLHLLSTVTPLISSYIIFIIKLAYLYHT